MATYSGLWDRFYGENYSNLKEGSVSVNSNESNAAMRRSLSKLLKQKGDRPLARLLYALVGAAAGGSASENLAQLTSAAGVSGGVNDPLSQGGKRTVANVALVNRVTTAADIALIQETITKQFGPTTYPTDKSGNGGGGKLGGW